MKKSLLPLFRLVVILLCLLQADLSAQALGWVKQLGGIAEDNVSDMEVDKDGNIFITGTFDYIADFDPGPNEFLLTSKGLSDVFIAKYDSLGNFIWANQFGSTGDVGGGQELAIQADGIPYLLCPTWSFSNQTYYTLGSVFDYTLITTIIQSFVIKFSSNGDIDKIQAVTYEVRSLTIDVKGSLYYKGSLSEEANENKLISNGITYTIAASSRGDFLMKVQDFDKVSWIAKIGNAGFEYNDIVKAIKIDSTGNAFVWSTFRNVLELTINDTSRNFIAIGSNLGFQRDVLLSGVDSTGKLLWAKQITGVSSGNAFGLDSASNVILCGQYYERVIVDPSNSKNFLLPIGLKTFGFYLAKFSKSGNLLLLKNNDLNLSYGIIDIGKSNILVASDQYQTRSYYSVFTLDFDLIRTTEIFYPRVVTSNYLRLVKLVRNKILASGNFSKTIDFDPSCKEYNISSFINSQDIFLLNINLDQIDSTVYKITAPKSICLGDPVTLSFPPNLKYAWSNGDTTSSISAKPSKVGSAKYGVTVENAEGCIFKDSISITVLAAPQLVGGGDKSICQGQSTPLIATGATSYTWNTGQTDSAIVVQPLVSTAYAVTLTNANDCSAVDTIQVRVNPLPVANAGLDQSICVGDSAVLEASGGTQYYWNNLKLQAKQVVNPTTTTNYSVVVTDANGCAATDEVVVTVHPNPDVDLLGIDTLKLKVGQFVILYAGKGQKFLWNTGDTANTIIIDQKSGNYCVTVTSKFGCQGSDCLFVQFTPTANQEVGAATVNIYPNPAQEFLTIGVQNSVVLPYDLQLFNALGQSVKQINHITMDLQNLDISDLPAGNYFVHLRFEGYTVVEQLVVWR